MSNTFLNIIQIFYQTNKHISISTTNKARNAFRDLDKNQADQYNKHKPKIQEVVMKLVVFDKDGTIVGSATGRPPSTLEEQYLLPGVPEKAAELKQKGYKIAIASNQGGVAWGFITYEQAEALVRSVAEMIGADAWRFCPHDKRAAGKPGSIPEFSISCSCRKPMPGMLLDLISYFGVQKKDVLFVGDSKEDEEAARAAGVRFEWADKFFGR